MIKSKIDARERALELAVKCFDAHGRIGSSNVVGFAKVFEQYLIGDAELPEVVDDNAHIKELFAVAQRELDKIKANNDKIFTGFSDALQGGNAGMAMGISGVPVQPDAE